MTLMKMKWNFLYVPEEHVVGPNTWKTMKRKTRDVSFIEGNICSVLLLDHLCTYLSLWYSDVVSVFDAISGAAGLKKLN